MCYTTLKLFPKIKIILRNNALEQIGVKSHYFDKDLDVIIINCLRE